MLRPQGCSELYSRVCVYSHPEAGENPNTSIRWYKMEAFG